MPRSDYPDPVVPRTFSSWVTKKATTECRVSQVAKSPLLRHPPATRDRPSGAVPGRGA